MEIKFENKDKVCMENCDIIKNHVAVYGFYGLTYFEIGHDNGDDFYNGLSLLNKTDLYDLKECIDKMIEEIERLEKIGD